MIGLETFVAFLATMGYGIAVARAIACPILFRLLRIFGPEDSYRINELTGRTPPRVRRRIAPVLRIATAPEQG